MAGTGLTGAADGEGDTASFNQPTGVTADGIGNLYVADMGNNKIRKISILEKAVSTLAGSGASGSTDATSGIYASFKSPSGLAASGSYLYIPDKNNHKIRRVSLQ